MSLLRKLASTWLRGVAVLVTLALVSIPAVAVGVGLMLLFGKVWGNVLYVLLVVPLAPVLLYPVWWVTLKVKPWAPWVDDGEHMIGTMADLRFEHRAVGADELRRRAADNG